MDKGGWTYTMSDGYRGGIYTGVTSNLTARIHQHREGTGSEFVAKYGFTRLVYMEFHGRIEDAIAREKAIKKWLRAWKIELIEATNPDWDDLFDILNA